MGGRGRWSGTAPRMANYKKAVIRRAKVSNYLLNPSKSPAKERFLRRLGYNMRNQARLQADLRKGLESNKAKVSEPNKYGRRHYQVNMDIGITRKAKVVTGWYTAKGSAIPELSTLRPYRGKKDDY